MVVSKGSATTTVLVTGIGGSMGIDVARCLRRDPSLRIVGTDSSPRARRIGEALCDEILALPRADREGAAWADALDTALARTGAAFVFVNPDPELGTLARLGRLPRATHGIPPPSITATCLDKAATAAAVRGSDDLPGTRELSGTAELEAAFAALGSPLWLRATTGPGGRGSLPVETPDEARAWMTYWERRGLANRWVIQELLPGRNLNWTGVYVAGRLVASAAMERSAYFLGGTTISGVSGQVSECMTVDPRPCAEVADRVVRRLDASPQGLYSVDLREDRAGRPRMTEVNPRLAGRPWLYANAGVNLPLAAVRALCGGDPGDALDAGGLSLGVHLHRQLDVEPIIDRPGG